MLPLPAPPARGRQAQSNVSARELTPPSRTIVACRFGARAARVLLVLTLSGWLAWDCAAKSSGGGGGGRSYSSGRSSSSSSSGGRSYSSGSSGSRSYSSGKSYGSSSSSGAGNSAGRSYSSGGNNRNASTRPNDATPPARNPSLTRPDSGAKPGSFSFDTAAARAQKEQASKRAFNQTQPPTTGNTSGSRLNDYSSSGRSFTRSSPPLYLDRQLYTTRTIRIHHYYQPYYSRPLVYYHDPYNSFFWWWLLDQSLDNRAMWAYSHRATMDDARYQALLAHDARLEAEIQRLEANQTPVNPAYVPPGLDRDLMYSDGYAQHAYQTRPTVAGRAFFRLFMIVTMLGVLWFFGWFIFCKRWN